MSKLKKLLDSGIIKDTVFGLTKSHSNTWLLLGKSFVVTPSNISEVYKSSIDYYNVSFGKLTGSIPSPSVVIKDYVNLIGLMFYDEFKEEKTIVPMPDIKEQEVLQDFSLFTVYVLLVEFRNIRISVLEEVIGYGNNTPDFFDLVYKISHEIQPSNDINESNWKNVTTNILWNIKQRFSVSNHIF